MSTWVLIGASVFNLVFDVLGQLPDDSVMAALHMLTDLYLSLTNSLYSIPALSYPALSINVQLSLSPRYLMATWIIHICSNPWVFHWLSMIDRVGLRWHRQDNHSSQLSDKIIEKELCSWPTSKVICTRRFNLRRRCDWRLVSVQIGRKKFPSWNEPIS